MNLQFVRTYTAETVIPPYALVKMGATDWSVAVATAATDQVIGVADLLGAAAIGDRVEVHRMGMAEVVCGGTVARGNFIGAGANGVAIGVSPAAGVMNYCVGQAEVSGVLNDRIQVMVLGGVTFKG